MFHKVFFVCFCLLLLCTFFEILIYRQLLILTLEADLIDLI